MDCNNTIGKPTGMRTPADMAHSLLASMRPASARRFAGKMAELAMEHKSLAEKDNDFWSQVVAALKELPT